MSCWAGWYLLMDKLVIDWSITSSFAMPSFTQQLSTFSRCICSVRLHSEEKQKYNICGICGHIWKHVWLLHLRNWQDHPLLSWNPGLESKVLDICYCLALCTQPPQKPIQTDSQHYTSSSLTPQHFFPKIVSHLYFFPVFNY